MAIPCPKLLQWLLLLKHRQPSKAPPSLSLPMPWPSNSNKVRLQVGQDWETARFVLLACLADYHYADVYMPRLMAGGV
jgi:hypothetical protein